jgi:UDP-GlcNAc:undecaprenyl-phosphate/decaprenyl-phosphate GlcNAc-1-phosphate transferase
MTDVLARAVVFAAGAAIGAAGCLVLPRALRALGLERPNYEGRAAGAGGGVLFALSALPWLASGDRLAVLAAAAAAGFAALGFLDDRWGTAEFKGLRGHLRALRSGRVTTGLVKAAGGGVLALLLAWQLQPLRGAGPPPPALLSGALIALCANLFNLLDLRPLRALKLFWLLGGALAVPGPLLLAQLLGISLPYARLEARRQVMLGDTGANALGAVTGLAAAALLPVWAQAAVVAVLAGVHAWTENHSLTSWIERRPGLRALDRWGWGTEQKEE